jgi:hypothetical protein
MISFLKMKCDARNGSRSLTLFLIWNLLWMLALHMPIHSSVYAQVPITSVAQLEPVPTNEYQLINVLQGSFDAIAIQDHYAYIGSLDWRGDMINTLFVVDIAIPYKPVITGSIQFPFGDRSNNVIKNLTIYGHYVYIANGWQGLRIVDVVDPAKPTLVASYPTSADTVAVAVSGSRAFVADTAGLQILDVSDPTTPVFMASYLPSASNRWVINVSILNNYAYVTEGMPAIPERGALAIIDISDPADPTLVSTFAIPGIGGTTVSGSYVYATTGIDFDGGGVDIVDISDPALPHRVIRLDQFGPCKDNKLVATLLYLTCRTYHVIQTLVVLDTSNVAEPSVIDIVHFESGRPEAVAVKNDYVYVSGLSYQGRFPNGLYVFKALPNHVYLPYGRK